MASTKLTLFTNCPINTGVFKIVRYRLSTSATIGRRGFHRSWRGGIMKELPLHVFDSYRQRFEVKLPRSVRLNKGFRTMVLSTIFCLISTLRSSLLLQRTFYWPYRTLIARYWRQDINNLFKFESKLSIFTCLMYDNYYYNLRNLLPLFLPAGVKIPLIKNPLTSVIATKEQSCKWRKWNCFHLVARVSDMHTKKLQVCQNSELKAVTGDPPLSSMHHLQNEASIRHITEQ